MWGLRTRRFEPYTLGVILLCAAWTAQTWFGKDLEEAGCCTRHLLWQGDLWRAVTTIFLHGAWWHLAVNGLALYFIGPFIVQGAGGLVFLGTVIFGSFAGLSASLFFNEPNVALVGISGGVLGLLGLILAVEWRHSRGFLDFLRQRNTIVVLSVLLLNAVLAVVLEKRLGNVRIDHAAHLGGLFFGLVFGLALIGRRRTRPGAGLAAAALFALLPLAAAAYPAWTKSDIRYLRVYAEEAGRRGDRAKQERMWSFVLELDEGHPIAIARLAMLRDDETIFRRLREPFGDQEKLPVVYACLTLAERRLESDPEAAGRLVALASGIELKALGAEWSALALEAEKAGLNKLALRAFSEASRRLPDSKAWAAARHALVLHQERLKQEKNDKGEPLAPQEKLQRANDAADEALRAAGGLAHAEGEERDRLERDMAVFSNQILRRAGELAVVDPPPEGLRALWGRLKRLYLRLADNSYERPSEAGFLYLSAVSWWFEVEAESVDPELLSAVANRFKAALGLARERGDRALAGQIEAWFRARGLRVPDLARTEGGG